MRLYLQVLILTILVTLIFQVEMLKVRVEDAYDKAEDAAVISALLLNEAPPKRKPFSYERYKAPEIDSESPWMLEEPVPEFIPPPDTF
jgi:hypothetical protein